MTKEMDTVDRMFDELSHNFLGFDSLFRNSDSAYASKYSAFPPTNIIRYGDDGQNFRIEIAVAGYSENDIDIEYDDGVLTVKGKAHKENDENRDDEEYVFRGIAKREFEKRFNVADTIVVDSANFENGILSIYMHNELPEHRQPRKINISKT